MVEGDFNVIDISYPSDGFGIVSGSCFRAFDTRKKCDSADMAARVSAGLRINADEREICCLHARFLGQLASRRLLYGFTYFDESARKREIALVGRIFAPDHKHAAVPVDNDAIGGEKRGFRKRHDNSIYVESHNVKTAVSAGLLLFRDRNGLEVLLAHPGGPYWRNKDDGAWTVPKGEILDGEAEYDTALREFVEETGFRPHGLVISLGSIRQAGGKHVHVWAVEDDWDPETLVSNSFTIEWPPRSGQTLHFPEVDRAQWFDLKIAHTKILKSQSEFLNRLELLRRAK